MNILFLFVYSKIKIFCCSFTCTLSWSLLWHVYVAQWLLFHTNDLHIDDGHVFCDVISPASRHPRELNVAAVQCTFLPIRIEIKIIKCISLWHFWSRKIPREKRSEKAAIRLPMASRFQHHGQLIGGWKSGWWCCTLVLPWFLPLYLEAGVFPSSWPSKWPFKTHGNNKAENNSTNNR